MKIVISGVNLIEGGPLKVFKDVVNAFVEHSHYEVVCLVHDSSLFQEFHNPRITFLEFSSIKSSWFRRLWFEYVESNTLSKELRPDIWLAMHDITPRVSTPIRLVYCHNPSPFYTASTKEIKYDFKLFLFSWFYKLLYKVNIKKNSAVIVQQAWIGEFIKNELGARNYIVSKPVDVNKTHRGEPVTTENKPEIVLFYPAFARTFKNFELLLESMKYLYEYHPNVYQKIRLRLTIDKCSNKYAASLISKYKFLGQVDFMGVLSYQEVVLEYQKCDVVIFPSKLETWGLPISEAKEFSKPVILSDLPYAHETLGCYDQACFINPDDCKALADKLGDLVNGKQVFSSSVFTGSANEVSSWPELVSVVNDLVKSE